MADQAPGGPSRFQRFLKRLLDILASALGLVLLSPVLALTALAVRLSGPGPVIFRQERVGRFGRPFRLWKFRTMVADAPARGAPLTVAGDPRITRIGAFLRAAKIDELPQLWNVLRGDMSLVGPRPEVPRYVALYDEEQRRVLSVRPGITDYASMAYFDENALLAQSPDPERTYVQSVMPDKLRLNLLYLQRMSLKEDLRILLATVLMALERLSGRSGGRVMQVVADALVVAGALSVAYWVRFEWPMPDIPRKQWILLLPYTVIAQVGVNLLTGVYRVLWRYVSLYDLARFARSVGLVTGVFVAFRLAAPENPYYRLPLSVALAYGVLAFSGMVALRLLRRWIHESTAVGAQTRPATEKALILGAGDNGRAVARECRVRPALGIRVAGFVDDDPAKQGMEIEGVQVLGSLERLPELVARTGATQALLAISDLPLARKREVVDLCGRLDVRLRVLPGTSDLIAGRAQVAPVREVRIEDLLGREVAQLTRDDPLLAPVYGDKRVLVTGAAGSIGSELCRQVAALHPARLILADQDESGLFLLDQELRWRWPDLSPVVLVRDIREEDKVREVFREHRPQVVIHAAAYKHVPLMEQNPREAIEANVVGTRVVASLAAESGAEVFVMLSTDKAVRPTSVMGASKRVAELIVRGLGAAGTGTRFASVRFGNVLGSQGSVVPLFRDQIARGGPLTVTHPDVMRYFMTIPEASQLVLKAGTIGREGEVFVLDMGQPIRILDLARDMIRLSGFREGEIPIVFTGLRPGEKLFEELLLDRDGVVPTPVEKVFVARPELRDFPLLTRQVDALVDAARKGPPEAVRRALMAMDIEMRDPDTGGSGPAGGPR